MTAVRPGVLAVAALFVPGILTAPAARLAAQSHPDPGSEDGFRSQRMPPPFVLMGAEGAFERETVRGLPYSARTITEVEHDLADGNRIAGTWTGFVARDSEGRVRREQPLAAIGALVAQPDSPRLTVIHDPIGRQTLLLDPGTMTVRRVPWAAASDLRRHRADDGPRPPMLPGASFALPRRAPVAASTEALGAREIAGVPAQGTRSTYVIPAGRIGNERPLTIVSERWTSAELEVVLETHTSDPRTGRTRYRLVEVERSEPDRVLFEVPAGYTVEDAPPRRLPHAEGPRPR